jgi:ABC-type uncharacterized transport system auxiliary subunit
MKKKIALLMATLLTMASLAGCGATAKTNESTTKQGATTAANTAVKPQLELIVAHNQTSLQNPYALGTIKLNNFQVAKLQ